MCRQIRRERFLSFQYYSFSIYGGPLINPCMYASLLELRGKTKAAKKPHFFMELGELLIMSLDLCLIVKNKQRVSLLTFLSIHSFIYAWVFKHEFRVFTWTLGFKMEKRQTHKTIEPYDIYWTFNHIHQEIHLNNY